MNQLSQSDPLAVPSDDSLFAREPRVLVSILNYQSVDDSVIAIRSLQQQDYPNFALQLLDNASPGDCVARIRAEVPDVDIRVTDTNLGYCGGNNHALHQGLADGCDYVVVCNQDIEVAPDALRRLVETAASHADAGVVGAVELCHFTDTVRAARGSGFSFWTGRSIWSDDVPADQAVLRADYVQGAIVLFTRRALEAGVFMNEDLFMYGDEADLGFRLAGAGLTAYVDTRVVVRHKNRQKYYNARAGYLHQRNRVYLVHRYGRWYHRIAFHVGVTLVELPVKFCVRAMQGRARFAWACVLGYIDGVLGRMGAARATSLRA
ncbi:MAG TPA: glycosyltransferase family 2 protein [Gemmatimonadaceae bacterium]